MKYSEFKRWLEKKGAEVERSGKGSHKIVSYKGKKTTLPYHKGKEIGEGLRKEIIKQLGL